MKNLISMQNIYFLLILGMLSCGNDELGESNNKSTWLIPIGEIFDGGPGKDGIPSVDNPKFSSVQNIDFLEDDDLVIGIEADGEMKAYPHPILDWHEIVNDDISNLKISLTYCPLTGTAIAWDRVINGKETTFGVSGKLYNTNLIPYDRESDSNWSQMRLDCVNGDLIGSKITTYTVIETTWSTWKQAYPYSLVMNTETGFNRDYNDYPYGDYRTNNSNIIFPVSIDDSRLSAKERVFAMVEGETKRAYSLELFEEGKVIEDVIDNKDIIVIGSKTDNFIVAFKNQNLAGLTFVSNELPVIAEDENGNRITLTGDVVSGPLEGTKLASQSGYMGYFFALGAFFENIEIYE